MPLRDHFHSPVNDKHRPKAVFGGLPAELVRYLFDCLPLGYQAEPKIICRDEYEVLIYDETRLRTLVAAIELVSPANKDRPETREQFNNKVAALLRQDVCVAVVDIVTLHRANLYVQLLAQLGHADPALATPHDTYAVTLRGRKPPKKHGLLDAWYFPLTLGQSLPTIPLWLSPTRRVELSLEPSYQEVCRLLRIA
jgi:Protein of unknown function (DUF4058)